MRGSAARRWTASRTPTVAAVAVCLATLTCGCSSRSTSAGVPVPPPPAQPPQTPSPAAPASEPPPAATVAGPGTTSLDCALIAEPGEPIATVALVDRIDPSNAPRASNESERVLFRQLYETLIRLDCRGRVRPALAESWRLDADRRTWILTLREHARFSDGTAVTSTDVVASWTRDGGGHELQPHVSRLVQSVVPVDERTVAITLRSPRVDMPVALAHTDLAIAKSAAGSPWPLGTRTDGAALELDTAVAGADSAITIRRGNLPSIRFVVSPGDPRDLLDRSVDLLLTRDPAALDYAATLPHFQSVPLEWQRTRVLLTPGRSRGSGSLPDDARQTLATDAVRGEARGAVGPFWWQMLQDCEVAPAEPRERSKFTPRIVYDARDAASRDLAERLVALSRASGPVALPILGVLLPDRQRRSYQQAAGLTGEPLAAAWRRGLDAGYIISVDRRPLDRCRDIQVLTDSAHWVDPGTIVPLVETRLRAIVRRGRSGITTEWDGGLLIADVSGPDKR
jgi:hypothetical protein